MLLGLQRSEVRILSGRLIVMNITFSFKYFICVSMCMCMHTYVQLVTEARKSIDCPGAGINQES